MMNDTVSRSSSAVTAWLRARWLPVSVIAVVLVFGLYYPVGMLLAHKVDDRLDYEIPASDLPPNASRTVAMAAALIDREVNRSGWVANDPFFMPGSMLDNTVIVFISDNGEQHHSTASEFPVVLIGGKNLGLNTGGRTIVYPGVDTGGSGHRQVSNLWNTLGHLAGDPLDTFGKEGPYRVATGPLTELL